MRPMRVALTLGCLVAAGLCAGAAQAKEMKTWYIYCEGKVNGRQSVIISANLWPHLASSGYQVQLAAAAERYIAGSPGTELSGCAGISFGDRTIAAYNRENTAKMARGVGDAVFYVDMPEVVRPD